MSQTTTAPGCRADSDQLVDVRRRAIMSCLIGNFLEIYDFTVFGFFSANSLVKAQTFSGWSFHIICVVMAV